MLVRRMCARLLGCFLLTPIVFASSSLWSQAKTLDRNIEAVIVPGDTLKEFVSGVPLAELGVFAFDASTQSWNPIPFQIDEKNVLGDFVFPGQMDEVSGFDGNDEIVFMASDAGDRAFIWLNDPASEQYPRVELAIRDTLDAQNVKEAWVYVYRSSSFATSASTFISDVDYVSYTPSSDPTKGEDFVEGESYKIGGNEKGLFGALFLPAAPQTDLIDRQKIRGKTSFFLFSSFNEEDNIDFAGVSVIDDKVRVVRQLSLKLTSPLGDLLDVPFPAQYFRNSIFLGGTLNIPVDLPLGIDIEEIRHSIDLTSAASGMLFSNPNNSNIVIDAQSDAVDLSILEAPRFNYTHITGPPVGKSNGTPAVTGTMITLFQLPGTIGDTRSLFYKDTMGEGNPDDDDNSYGDTGVIINGEDIEGEFPLAFNLIFFADNQPASVGADLATNAENPLELQATSQTLSEVPVELIAFSANVEKNDVILNWVTASETNNFGFEIQRRLHGFEEWLRIGFVEGQGTTTTATQYRFVDPQLPAGTYDYRLKQIDTDGTFEFSNLITAVVGLPETFALFQNFPNPFNPETEIQYQLPALLNEASQSQRTVLVVYNLLGQEVRTLVNTEQSPGYYSVTWNGLDNSGNRVPSGVYLYRIRSGSFVETRKMVLVQ